MIDDDRPAEWRLMNDRNLVADVKSQLVEIATDSPTT